MIRLELTEQHFQITDAIVVGSFVIMVRNIGLIAQSDAIVINFASIKAANN